MKTVFRGASYLILALGILSNIAIGLAVLAVAVVLFIHGQWVGLVVWLFFGTSIVFFTADLVRFPFVLLAGVLLRAGESEETTAT